MASAVAATTLASLAPDTRRSFMFSSVGRDVLRLLPFLELPFMASRATPHARNAG
jgi:hypothetical protein